MAFVHRNIEWGLAPKGVAPYTPSISRQGTRQSERRLPMELTGTLTAVMALISFGFVAAVILGMI
jgi:hypothetical protein